MTNPGRAWGADESLRAGTGLDLGPLTRTARALIAAVAGLL